jgi:outer membrane protein TolC
MSKKSQRSNREMNGAQLCLACLVVVFVAGCTTAQHHRAADKEVYRIIESVENQIFGEARAFGIETEFTHRDPAGILPAEFIEGRLESGRRLLTLEEALELSVRQSRRYQTEKERLYLTALTLTGERHEFGPQFFASSRATFDGVIDGERQGRIASQAGVNQALRTGGRIGVGLANDLLRFYTGDPRSRAVSVISIDLVQPLLRGAGRYSPAVERLTQAERNVIYAIRSFSFFQDQYAVEIVNDYFSLLGLKDVVRNSYANYLSQVASTRRLDERAKDRESRSQVDFARQSELSARNSYVNSVAGYLNLLDQFKLKLGIPLAEQVQLDDTVLRQLEQVGLIDATLDREAAFRLAVERQLEILNSIDRFEDSKRKIRVAAQSLKADLNLFADASLSSEPPTDYLNFDLDNVRYGVGMQLNLPLDRLRERNNYRATLIAFESDLRGLSLALDNLKDRIDRGLRTLEQRRQNYSIQLNALQLANSRVYGNTLLLEAGRITPRDLVDSQNDQVQTQNAVTAALVSYQEVRMQLMLDLGLMDTSTDEFWFRDLLAERVDAEVRLAAPVLMPVDQLLSPEQIFYE